MGAGELWYVLHGFGQLAGRFVGYFDAIAGDDRVVIAPEAPHRFYLDPPDRPATERRVGASWMTREAREHDIADYVHYLDRVDATLRSCTRATRVTVLGFSQGVATATRWLALGAIRPDNLVLWGTGLPPDLDWVRARPALESCRVVLVGGTRDEAFPASQLELEAKQLTERSIAHEVVRYEGGHRVERAALLGLARRLSGRREG